MRHPRRPVEADASCPPDLHLHVPALLRRTAPFDAAAANSTFRRRLRHGGSRGMIALSTSSPGRRLTQGTAETLDALSPITASTAPPHEQIRDDLKAGRIGLARNRLPASTASAT